MISPSANTSRGRLSPTSPTRNAQGKTSNHRSQLGSRRSRLRMPSHAIRRAHETKSVKKLDVRTALIQFHDSGCNLACIGAVQKTGKNGIPSGGPCQHAATLTGFHTRNFGKQIAAASIKPVSEVAKCPQ